MVSEKPALVVPLGFAQVARAAVEAIVFGSAVRQALAATPGCAPRDGGVGTMPALTEVRSPRN